MPILGREKYQQLKLAGKSALITGASSGIGEACSIYLASLGVNLKMIARRGERLNELKNSILQSNPNITVELFPVDLLAENTVIELENKRALDCDIFINNAGLALGRDFVGELKANEIDQVIQTNVTIAMKLTNSVLKLMKTKGQGDIVHICSIASRESYAGGSIYCASKAALLAFSQSLRRESFGQNIRIINILPGMVATDFSRVRFHGDETKAKAVYQGMTPLSAEDIAFQVTTALTMPRHVNIDEITILATDQGSATTVYRR